MRKDFFDEWVEGKDLDDVLVTLRPYLTTERLERIEEALRGRIHGVEVAVEQASDLHNALAVLRTAEALGVTKAHFISQQGSVKGGWTTTQGALNWVDLRRHPEMGSFARQRRLEAYAIAGASLKGTLDLSELPATEKMCLLFGNEQRGLSEEAEQACDYLFKIPMQGMSQSLNLSVSAGIVLFDYLRRRREITGELGDLHGYDLLYERAWYYVQSVSPRLLKGLFSQKAQLASAK